MQLADNRRVFAYLRNIALVLVPVAFAGIYIVLVNSTIGICLETNDDRMIAEILSGTCTISPDAHAVYVNYALCLVVSGLYSIAPNIAWWGLCLVIAHFAALAAVSVAVVFMILNSDRDKAQGILMASLLMMVLYASDIRLLSVIQYTSAAAVLAGAGFVVLVLSKPGERVALFAFLALEGFAFALRSQSMLMILPLGITAVSVTYIVDLGFKGGARRLTVVFGSICGLLIVLELTNAIAYSDIDWRNYLQYNEARTSLFDYYGKPEYASVKEILESYGVSEASYEAFGTYDDVDGSGMPLQCLQEIASYASLAASNATLGQTAKLFIGCITLCLPIWVIVLAVFVASMLIAVKNKNLSLAFAVLAIAAATLVVLGYLSIKGRTPYRVVAPLALCVATLMAAVLLRGGSIQHRPGAGMPVLMVGLCLVVMCSMAVIQTSQASLINNEQAILAQRQHDIKQYCINHAEYRYIVEEKAVIHSQGSPFDSSNYGYKNYVLSGSWYAASPAAQEYSDWYLRDWQAVRLIVCCEEKYLECNDKAIRYIEERTSAKANQVDEIWDSSGEKYLVYSFD